MSLSIFKLNSSGARLAGAALLVAVLGSVTLSAWAMPGGHGGAPAWA